RASPHARRGARARGEGHEPDPGATRALEPGDDEPLPGAHRAGRAREGNAGADVEPVRGDDVHERSGGACRPGATLTVVAGDVQLPEPGVALLLSDDVLFWDADPEAHVNAARRAAGRARARGGCLGRARRPER